MSAQPQVLVAAYTCSICRQTVMLKDPILIGEKPAERRSRIGQMMVEHLMQNHQQQFATMIAAGEGFKGWLFSRTFSHNDADLAAAQETSRQNFRQFLFGSERLVITDEQIQQTVEGQLKLKENLAGVVASEQSVMDLQNGIISLMKQLRDALRA